jgi:hypothetical protein
LAICSQIGSGLISHPDAPAELEPLGAEFAVEPDCVPQAEKTPAPAMEIDKTSNKTRKLRCI